jgi:F-type H+-transporting ATPase subunit epsilon
MRLKIFQPSELFLDEEVSKVVGEGPEGCFGILPLHIDMTTALVPGVLEYANERGTEAFIALNGGILIKQGDQVLISTRMAVKGELGALEASVNAFVTEIDEKEKKARSAVAKLEADFVRRFVEFGKNA